LRILDWARTIHLELIPLRSLRLCGENARTGERNPKSKIQNPSLLCVLCASAVKTLCGEMLIAAMFGAVMFGAASGCHSRPVPIVDEPLLSIGKQRGVSAEQLRRGRALLVTECAYCHTPVQPSSISMERWEKALPRMIEKSQLTSADEAAIRAYVIAARALAGAAIGSNPE